MFHVKTPYTQRQDIIYISKKNKMNEIVKWIIQVRSKLESTCLITCLSQIYFFSYCMQECISIYVPISYNNYFNFSYLTYF
jgi:pyruvate/oxaloacetate carboxyltransferase